MQGTPEIQEIMIRIKPHLKEGVDNYNSTWNKIAKWFDEYKCKCGNSCSCAHTQLISKNE
jgi:hypothetical protein